ncbi:hypothetical protein Q9L42_017280 [Methylomarinum sp. Ch1-1]|uniref:Uncharacterized protein n=1 Tax=Methylomarinum roseum TaxID=3067653 RepID=A0AAU7NT40_9GAMM|nr:hypothetical protein [Methylomarinum sp. Ch1-1]MDP4519912.1 hypothetical protein [Methylomarinum sp. Ch1-1]
MNISATRKLFPAAVFAYQVKMDKGNEIGIALSPMYATEAQANTVLQKIKKIRPGAYVAGMTFLFSSIDEPGRAAILASIQQPIGDVRGHAKPIAWLGLGEKTGKGRKGDAVFVVDDFKPSVNAAEAAKLHGKAERFIRRQQKTRLN